MGGRGRERGDDGREGRGGPWAIPSGSAARPLGDRTQTSASIPLSSLAESRRPTDDRRKTDHRFAGLL